MTDRMNPTDQATQLTQEAEEFIGDCRLVGMLDGAHGSNEPFFRSALRAIETAAARRAIEGSGVVAHLLHARVPGCDGSDDPDGCEACHVAAAALPRPEEPRVDEGHEQRRSDAWPSINGLTPGSGVVEALDNAYTERNRLVAALIKVGGYRAVTFEDQSEPGWWVVYADTPAGQVSWHVGVRDIGLFLDTPSVIANPWDGHDTDEKYRRLAVLTRPEEPRDDVTGRCDGCHHAPHAGRCEGSTGWGRCACATALPRPEEPRPTVPCVCGGTLDEASILSADHYPVPEEAR